MPVRNFLDQAFCSSWSCLDLLNQSPDSAIDLLLFVLVFSLIKGKAHTYEDLANELRTVKPTRQYVNPTGPVTFYLKAGLDRKVGYIITD
ncbi:MAG: DUF4165 domain-containing protein [Desulfobacteraceae bacterium]